MQDVYFQRWVGTWPQGIDWTRAVMGTHVAAALRTISDDFELAGRHSEILAYGARRVDPISGYFADLIASYFGQDAFAIRNQAYDDMLWVVLGWLEAIQFVDGHSTLMGGAGLGETFEDESWYGNDWIPAFAHRSRVFWELASKGWDTKLCGGGMIWNPRLAPYKNAITNQLFISASIGMYLHFPGDQNTSPFDNDSHSNATEAAPGHMTIEWDAHDPIFWRAAQAAHDWLSTSNMTNSQGLYADGFHISGHTDGGNNTKCDQRDEMVYTYNQGVILSGLLGLFRTTGRESYLHEGHALIENVIRATGWDLDRNRPVEDIGRLLPGQLPPWRGLGRAGVLEDACDVSGRCSQDAQTFKGIWMHHFAAFCGAGAAALGSADYYHYYHHHPPSGATAGGLDEDEMKRVAAWHVSRCKAYLGWLRHNAEAALGTRDGRGRFGMWWTAGLLRGVGVGAAADMYLPPEALPPAGDGIVDYRNFGVPSDEVWAGAGAEEKPTVDYDYGSRDGGQRPLVAAAVKRDAEAPGRRRDEAGAANLDPRDPNCRGRGRTVETQGGGLAVLRALWEVSKHDL